MVLKIIGGLAVVLIITFTGLAAIGSGSSQTKYIPNMRAEIDGNNLSIIADDDNPFTVQRVVLNGRENEKGCDSRVAVLQDAQNPDFPSSTLPAALKRGRNIFFNTGGSCGEILSADIYTDRGVSHLKFGDATN